jgi:hypothetical protein
MASAWLIRRFIDTKAKFRFVPARGYRPGRGELRFDMFEGEFTHEGDCCTFETLLARFGLADPALAAIGEVVHDLDCKDGKFGRRETHGIGAIVRGLVRSHDRDADRVAAAALVFDGLHAHFQARRP